MRERLLRAPSPALVISFIALFVAASGVSYAALRVGSRNIGNGAVTTKKIKNRAVSTGKLSSSARTKGFVTNRFARISLPGGAVTNVARLNLPRGASYIVTASVHLGSAAPSAAGNPVTCVLVDDGRTLTDGSGHSHRAELEATVAMTAATNGGGRIVVHCTPAADAQAASRVITATRVASVQR